nr:hypothetical protein BHI3_35500 [Bacteriovorax sp. HI3]
MFKLDQKGVSLPLVIGAAAIILANTYYFYEMNKNSTRDASFAKSEISEQSEQARIAAFLADLKVCSDDNFKGRSLVSLTTPISFSLKRGTPGVNFLEVGKSYGQDHYTVANYYLIADPNAVSNELRYSLMVNYSLAKNATLNKGNLPKRTATAKVPLFIQVDGSGNISRCYAVPDEDRTASSTAIEKAMQATCKVDTTTNPTPTAYLRSSTSIAECVNNVKEGVCGTGQVFNGMTITGKTPTYTLGAENLLENSCAAYVNVCPTTPVQQVFRLINNSTPTCEVPENGGCTDAMMVKNSADADKISCSQGCGTNQLYNRMNASGVPTCYNRQTPCPSGQYVKYINATGTVVTCEYIKYRDAYCTTSYYARDLDPNSASNPLACEYYNKYKDCAGTYGFVTSFSTVTPSCKTLNF